MAYYTTQQAKNDPNIREIIRLEMKAHRISTAVNRYLLESVIYLLLKTQMVKKHYRSRLTHIRTDQRIQNFLKMGRRSAAKIAELTNEDPAKIAKVAVISICNSKKVEKFGKSWEEI
ncbi:MAG: hypothetical protein IPJ40_18260 [Saprospirales bacterium]|nr:hypothetical protein [Saprospirales bacterium]